MKLIFKNWREYVIREIKSSIDLEKDFWAPWVEELKKDQWIVEDETKFILIGEGAHRKVYRPLKDSNYVVKVAKGPEKVYQNYIESELSLKYPELFPKTFVHGECYISHTKKEKCGYDWIVVESITEIGDDPELLAEMLQVNFPEIGKLIDKNSIEIWNMILESIKFGADKYKSYTSIEKEQPIRHTQGEPKPTLRQIFDLGMDNNIYNELFRAVTIDQIDVEELKSGRNIGIDSRSNFKIIDASVTTQSSGEPESYFE
jgi:hypothetical protein